MPNIPGPEEIAKNIDPFGDTEDESLVAFARSNANAGIFWVGLIVLVIIVG